MPNSKKQTLRIGIVIIIAVAIMAVKFLAGSMFARLITDSYQSDDFILLSEKLNFPFTIIIYTN